MSEGGDHSSTLGRVPCAEMREQWAWGAGTQIQSEEGGPSTCSDSTP